MSEEIRFYSKSGTHAFFSNFARFPFELDGMNWKTVEHYFQANKVNQREPDWHGAMSRIARARTPEEAKAMGKKTSLRLDWEEEKENVMFKALRAKFTTNDWLKGQLLATGEAILIEDSPWDAYWGCGKKGDGLNRLGHLLMDLREELKNEELKAKIAALES